MSRFAYLSVLSIILALGVQGCDSIQPNEPGTLVVEAFFNVGQPLPVVTVKQAAALNSLTESAVEATVSLMMQGQSFAYVRTSEPLRYAPEDSEYVIPSGAAYQLTVSTEERTALVSGITPQVISIDRISVEVSKTPIFAVFVDTLNLGLDSLNLSLDASQRFIYPVEVAIEWRGADVADFNPWIESRLEPVTSFSSSIVDFFLLPSQVFPESDTTPVDGNLHSWSGVYAVPVTEESSPLPDHELKITLLRSDEQYARFATSRNDPVRREPASNLQGAIGFVGAISVDSVRVTVSNQ